MFPADTALTEEDFRMYLSLTEQPAYAGIMKASRELVVNPLDLVRTLQDNFDK